MIKQLLNSAIANYRDLSVSCIFISLSPRLWQIIDLFATDKSGHFAQPCPIIVHYYYPTSVITVRISREMTTNIPLYLYG